MLNNVLEYQGPIAQASEILGVSEHHTRRLLAAYRRDGAAALSHGNRGRQLHNVDLRHLARLNPRGGQQACSSVHRRWEVCGFRCLLPPIRNSSELRGSE